MSEAQIKSWSQDKLDNKVRALVDQGDRAQAMQIIEVACDHDLLKIMKYTQKL